MFGDIWNIKEKLIAITLFFNLREAGNRPRAEDGDPCRPRQGNLEQPEGRPQRPSGRQEVRRPREEGRELNLTKIPTSDDSIQVENCQFVHPSMDSCLGYAC